MRSTVILGMVECTPDFGEQLGIFDNPLRVTLGPDSYGQFVAAALLNHALLLGVPMLHAGVGAAYALVGGVSLRQGFAWARFPSLSIVPTTYWIGSTVSAAMVVGIYGEEQWHVALAVVSTALCTAIPVALLAYQLRDWGARMVPGAVPARQLRIEAAARKESSRRKLSGLRQLGIWAEWWIDGGVKWRDLPGRQGYCRGNRLLFMDYTEKQHWFMAVELFITVVVGVLDGVRLGPQQCGANLAVIIAVLASFLLSLLILRPYNSPFGAIFAVITTLMQLVSASLMLAWMISGRVNYREDAEIVSLMSIYLLLAKTVFDVLPKLKQLLMTGIALVAHCTNSPSRPIPPLDRALLNRHFEIAGDLELESRIRPEGEAPIADANAGEMYEEDRLPLQRVFESDFVGEDIELSVAHSRDVPAATEAHQDLESRDELPRSEASEEMMNSFSEPFLLYSTSAANPLTWSR